MIPGSFIYLCIISFSLSLVTLPFSESLSYLCFISFSLSRSLIPRSSPYLWFIVFISGFSPYRLFPHLWGPPRWPRERKVPGSNPAFAGIFSGSSHTCDLNTDTPVAPGVIRSALGLVGPVSVYCDWVRWKVGSATSISVWQHVKLSVQIRP